MHVSFFKARTSTKHQTHTISAPYNKFKHTTYCSLRFHAHSSSNTTLWSLNKITNCCELLSDFLSLFFEHNPAKRKPPNRLRCELLSDFLSLFFEHNQPLPWCFWRSVVNCFQIFYLCSSNTTFMEFDIIGNCCELLSDFLSLFFEHNRVCVKQR